MMGDEGRCSPLGRELLHLPRGAVADGHRRVRAAAAGERCGDAARARVARGGGRAPRRDAEIGRDHDLLGRDRQLDLVEIDGARLAQLAPRTSRARTTSRHLPTCMQLAPRTPRARATAEWGSARWQVRRQVRRRRQQRRRRRRRRRRERLRSRRRPSTRPPLRATISL